MNEVWRERLLRLTIAGMELLALSTLFSLINFKVLDGTLSAPGVLAIYGFALTCNLLSPVRRLPPKFSYLVNALMWCVATGLIIKVLVFPALGLLDPLFFLSVPRAIAGYAAGLRPELIILICSLFLWPLGFRLARIRLSFTVSLAEFQCGLAVILFIYFLNSQVGASSLDSLPVSLAFFTLSLTALAISRAGGQTGWWHGRQVPFWLLVFVISIGLILFTGFTVGTLANYDLLNILLTPLRGAWWLIVRFMQFLAEHTATGGALKTPDGGTGFTPAEDPDEILKNLLRAPPWLRDLLGFVMEMVWLVVILIALWRFGSSLFDWLRVRFTSRYPAEIESSNGSLKDDLIGLLRRLTRWLGEFFRRTNAPVIAPEAASTRQLYRELLAWGAARGTRRAPEQTPFEYLSVLAATFPSAATDFRIITECYVNTRYGAGLPDVDSLKELKVIWRKIKLNN